MADGYFVQFDDLDRHEIFSGISISPLIGTNIMLSLARLEPHSTLPLAHHPEEEMGIVLEGEIEVWVGDQHQILRAGGVYVIPSNTPHEAKTNESHALVLDVFNPVRQDYSALLND